MGNPWKDGECSTDDAKDFADYIGEGQAHHTPPPAKKVKLMSEGEDVVESEKGAEPAEPKSEDVFASSQPSGESGGSSYETCNETVEGNDEDEGDDEETPRKSQETAENPPPSSQAEMMEVDQKSQDVFSEDPQKTPVKSVKNEPKLSKSTPGNTSLAEYKDCSTELEQKTPKASQIMPKSDENAQKTAEKSQNSFKYDAGSLDKKTPKRQVLSEIMKNEPGSVEKAPNLSDFVENKPKLAEKMTPKRQILSDIMKNKPDSMKKEPKSAEKSRNSFKYEPGSLEKTTPKRQNPSETMKIELKSAEKVQKSAEKIVKSSPRPSAPFDFDCDEPKSGGIATKPSPKPHTPFDIVLSSPNLTARLHRTFEKADSPAVSIGPKSAEKPDESMEIDDDEKIPKTPETAKETLFNDQRSSSRRSMKSSGRTPEIKSLAGTSAPPSIETKPQSTPISETPKNTRRVLEKSFNRVSIPKPNFDIALGQEEGEETILKNVTLRRKASPKETIDMKPLKSIVNKIQQKEEKEEEVVPDSQDYQSIHISDDEGPMEIDEPNNPESEEYEGPPEINRADSDEADNDVMGEMEQEMERNQERMEEEDEVETERGANNKTMEQLLDVDPEEENRELEAAAASAAAASSSNSRCASTSSSHHNQRPKQRAVSPEHDHSYDEMVAQNCQEFEKSDLVFQPDFINIDPKYHPRYCKVKGLPDRKNDYHPVIMNQPWCITNYKDERNPIYKKQKALLAAYLRGHRSGLGGYQLFEGLIHDVAGLEDQPMTSLFKFYEQRISEIGPDEMHEQFANVVSWALKAEDLLPKRIYPLCDEVISGTFSREQCVAIVARMFFHRKRKTGLDFFAIMNSREEICVEKLRFIFAYIEKMSSPDAPKGIVSFRRVRRTRSKIIEKWQTQKKVLMPEARIIEGTVIEETALCTQVDFANEYLGGGVLTLGSVQEEIRFLMCPEMMVSMFLQRGPMEDMEAFSIVGAHVFSSYTGYSRQLKWAPLKPQHARQNHFYDAYDRLQVETIAIDATEYKTYWREAYKQYTPDSIQRELMKAIVGFGCQRPVFKNIPIVSGWWGCGAFGGNKQLKFLIQLMAAGFVKRPLYICPFGDLETAAECMQMMETFKELETTIGQVYNALANMEAKRGSFPKDVFAHVTRELDSL